MLICYSVKGLSSIKSSCLSPSSMVRMVSSVYLGATRIPKELLPVVEMDSGKYSYLIYCTYNPFAINAHAMYVIFFGPQCHPNRGW